MRRRHPVALALAATLALAGCTGTDDPDPSPTPSGSSPGGSSGNDGPTAEDLAKDILTDKTWGAAPTSTPITVTHQDWRFEMAVESLTTDATQTVLTLKVRAVDTSSVGVFYGVENNAAWRDLNQLSIEDTTSQVRFFPYRYQFLPEGGKSIKFGSTGHNEPWLPADQWVTIGGIVLPPLPQGVTHVKVNIPKSLNTTAGLGTTPIGTLEDVPVDRSTTN